MDFYKDSNQSTDTLESHIKHQLNHNAKESHSQFVDIDTKKFLAKALQELIETSDINTRLDLLSTIDACLCNIAFPIADIIAEFGTIPVVIEGLKVPSTPTCELCLRVIIEIQYFANDLIFPYLIDSYHLLLRLFPSPSFLLYVIAILFNIIIYHPQQAFVLAADFQIVHMVCGFISSFQNFDQQMLFFLLQFVYSIFERIPNQDILNEPVLDNGPMILSPMIVIYHVIMDPESLNMRSRAIVPAIRLLNFILTHWHQEQPFPDSPELFERLKYFILNVNDFNINNPSTQIYLEAVAYFSTRLREADLFGNDDPFRQSPDCVEIVRSVLFDYSLNSMPPLRLLFLLSNAAVYSDLAYVIFTDLSFQQMAREYPTFSADEKECYFMLIYNIVYHSAADILSQSFAPSVITDSLEALIGTPSMVVRSWILQQVLYLASNFPDFFVQPDFDLEICIDYLSDLTESDLPPDLADNACAILDIFNNMTR